MDRLREKFLKVVLWIYIGTIIIIFIFYRQDKKVEIIKKHNQISEIKLGGFKLQNNKSKIDELKINKPKITAISKLGAKLQFEEECKLKSITKADIKKVSIAAVGDVLAHKVLQNQARGHSQGFKNIWSQAIPYLRKADIAYANLEGTVATGMGYTGWPNFNYPPSILDDLKDSGIDILSTANNHSLDRGSKGVNLTIEALRDRDISYTGTKNTDFKNVPWYTLTRVNGMTIAWIACTHHANFIDKSGRRDPYNQVLYCGSKAAWNPSKLNPVLEEEIKALAGSKNIDAIIVTPHWGIENENKPRKEQKQMAQAMANAGATAIIGTHPHVIQPWQMLATEDGRKVLVNYSLGNFITRAERASKNWRNAMLLIVNLSQHGSEKARVSGVGVVPMEMTYSRGVHRLTVNTKSAKNHAARFLSRKNFVNIDQYFSKLGGCESKY
ncbi:CapA family protein [Mastigocoleus testarum]|uniref:Capsule synthesis protein CapA domain-containing protein n=1 Tax=Mastigocoleus testarum BC008 TaxID=371196 RepID=A0A0V7ZGE5_9CYAN|nr:CapA family protein [Mastigocoleus testarum]KST63619.1 hypothetical protein BC008_14250 [Mastigocoleus testarum BC008]